jgi:hypothetical protein
MGSARSVRISGGPDYVEINSNGVFDHEDWMPVIVKVKAGDFSGIFDASFLRSDFQTLRDGFARLYSFQSKEFDFGAIEGQLALAVTGDRGGNFTAKCEASDSSFRRRLSFQINFAQSYIPEILKGLDSLIG